MLFYFNSSWSQFLCTNPVTTAPNPAVIQVYQHGDEGTSSYPQANLRQLRKFLNLKLFLFLTKQMKTHATIVGTDTLKSCTFSISLHFCNGAVSRHIFAQKHHFRCSRKASNITFSLNGTTTCAVSICFLFLNFLIVLVSCISSNRCDLNE